MLTERPAKTCCEMIRTNAACVSAVVAHPFVACCGPGKRSKVVLMRVCQQRAINALASSKSALGYLRAAHSGVRPWDGPACSSRLVQHGLHLLRRESGGESAGRSKTHTPATCLN